MVEEANMASLTSPDIDFSPFIRTDYLKKSVQELQKKVESNDKFAAYELAERFERQKNDDDALKYYRLSAEWGDVAAPLRAALILHRKQRFNEAVPYLEMSISRTNDAAAHFLLGQYYFENKIGTFFSRGKNKFKHFLAAAEQGHPKAQFILALLYAEGDGVKKSIEHYIFWLRCSQLNGNPTAIRYLNRVMGESEHMCRVWKEELAKADKQIAGHETYIEEYIRRKTRKEIDTEGSEKG